MFPLGLRFNPWWKHALMYLVRMQFKIICIMVNTRTCTSCSNGVKIFLSTHVFKINWLILFMTCKFVTPCHDKNVICEFTIRNLYGTLFHVILTWDLLYPCHNFLIKTYLMQHALFKMTKKHFTENVLINQFGLLLTWFYPHFYQNHTSCIWINFVPFH